MPLNKNLLAMSTSKEELTDSEYRQQNKNNLPFGLKFQEYY